MRTVILNTHDIYVRSPKGQKPARGREKVFVNSEYDYWSTGTIEAAKMAGYQVLVATANAELGEHDRWWLSLVAREHVFLGEKPDYSKISQMDRDAGYVEEIRCVSAGWMAAFATLGLPWPIDHDGAPRYWAEAVHTLASWGIPKAGDFAPELVAP